MHTSGGYLTHTSWAHWAHFDAKPDDVHWCTADLAWVTAHTYEIYGPLSNGLTPFLTTNGGVNSGFMIVQYSAASMVSENKVLAHPASVDSIPSSANQEDIVSMGTTAARKAGWILQNTLSVLAFELLTACQAVDIRRREGSFGQGLSPVLQAVYDAVRREVAFYETDREIQPEPVEGHDGRWRVVLDGVERIVDARRVARTRAGQG